MMMVVSVSGTVADCTFLRSDRTSVHLSDFKAEALLIIFLRHLA